MLDPSALFLITVLGSLDDLIHGKADKARRCALLVRSSGGNQSRLVGRIYLSLHNSNPSSEYYWNVTCALVRKIKTVK